MSKIPVIIVGFSLLVLQGLFPMKDIMLSDEYYLYFEKGICKESFHIKEMRKIGGKKVIVEAGAPWAITLAEEILKNGKGYAETGSYILSNDLFKIGNNRADGYEHFIKSYKKYLISTLAGDYNNVDLKTLNDAAVLLSMSEKLDRPPFFRLNKAAPDHASFLGLQKQWKIKGKRDAFRYALTDFCYYLVLNICFIFTLASILWFSIIMAVCKTRAALKAVRAPLIMQLIVMAIGFLAVPILVLKIPFLIYSFPDILAFFVFLLFIPVIALIWLIELVVMAVKKKKIQAL